MTETEYRTSPDHETTGWPPGVPYIIGNEGCERFSFYGMRSILTLFMAEVLYVNHPVFKSDPDDYAKAHYHLFVAAVYALPMIGAILADRLIGKYNTILWLSLVYTGGHAVLAAFEGSVWGLWVGLGLIAVGSGGIKPCVSANVGDQFGKNNWFRVRTVYQAFYFIINFGSFFATLLIPFLWRHYGASIAFGLPGILMAAATVVFWTGRKKFVHVPAKPGGKVGLLDALSSTALFLSVGHLFFTGDLSWWLELLLSVFFLVLGFYLFSERQKRHPDDGFLAVLVFAVKSWVARGADREVAAADQQTPAPSPEVEERRAKLRKSRLFGPAVRHFGIEATEGPVAVLSIMSVFFLVSIFWALFDQHGSSWILQAKQMELSVALPLYGALEVQPSQVAALNPLLVMLLIPLTNYVIYPGVEKLGFKATPLRRMTAGMVVAALSFVAVALIQARIDAQGNGVVPIEWQIIPYIIITLAEVMVSITGLEFAYTQAPKRMKSTIMGFWLLTVSLGNVLVSIISLIKLPLAEFFWVFAGLMAGAALLFGLRAYFYRSQDYIQD
ncbi:MAG: POT family MFS transporter [Myxococcales bacterium]|nr:POT family MFS transporter [Myxococcales bacterium]MCB9578723.1 POT family MFS transporter [Polyangiaceae bacterium]